MGIAFQMTKVLCPVCWGMLPVRRAHSSSRGLAPVDAFLSGSCFTGGLVGQGFLPEDWDKFLVKYLYPSFTPTVGLFVAGSVGYGVVKYLQNEELKGQK
ncbi:hypothetical protein ACFX2I_041825 [Malus domestica]